jgi:hypothetical protein
MDHVFTLKVNILMHEMGMFTPIHSHGRGLICYMSNAKGICIKHVCCLLF